MKQSQDNHVDKATRKLNETSGWNTKRNACPQRCTAVLRQVVVQKNGTWKSHQRVSSPVFQKVANESAQGVSRMRLKWG